jgi:hypothetical protein
MWEVLNAAAAGGAGAAALVGRLVLDLACTSIIVLVVHYRLYRDRDYAFTYLVLNLVTFSLVHVLSTVPIGVGSALGLFAVFGILRYRAEAIQVRNLTYLFVVIGIALMNALANGGITVPQLVILNVVIVGMVWLLEVAPFSGREQSRGIVYDRLDLLAPDRREDLVADIRARTHLPVGRYEIGDVDLLRDTADITIHYRE